MPYPTNTLCHYLNAESTFSDFHQANLRASNLKSDMSFPLCKQSVGFIGLGAMGLPMAENLAIKLPQSSQMFVFDVVAKGMNGLCSRHPERVVACSSAKELAERSVRVQFLILCSAQHEARSKQQAIF